MTTHQPRDDGLPAEASPVERRLVEALGPAQPRSTSPDLFDRVLESIGDDRVRRSAIRRGVAYAADVFHDNPQTGKSYIVLTDIVYYLIFAAYILFTVNFEPRTAWAGTVVPAQVGFEAARIGGILLIIGILHGLNIILMPVLGRLFSLNRRLPGDR
ncbi:hypothetical protein [Kribbella catacumbae]|uniref:hypothetical protein n=1 Tax=Kribbella catacumbae TaxID=460086 RepID=UPI00036D1A85|nr:hypothetical protein [Kribbella catacumbae]